MYDNDTSMAGVIRCSGTTTKREKYLFGIKFKIIFIM